MGKLVQLRDQFLKFHAVPCPVGQQKLFQKAGKGQQLLVGGALPIRDQRPQADAVSQAFLLLDGLDLSEQ